MGYLAYKDSAGSHALSGNAYVNPTAGTARLFICTGSASSNTIAYGWTTNSSASQYSPIRAVIKPGVTGYIGRTETISVTTTSQKTTAASPITRSYTSNTKVTTASTYISSSSSTSRFNLMISPT